VYPAGREETTSGEMTEGEKRPLGADIVDLQRGAEKTGKRRELCSTEWSVRSLEKYVASSNRGMPRRVKKRLRHRIFQRT
jgi:hypothetical protein